uniref:uncharacterized protein isoform X3 n=1 Tax=Myxine glutinosa TaxID=7769 RepID=UPI00358F36FF
MPICGVFRCSNKPGVRPGVKFYKTPKLLLNQGEETRNLSEERRRLWKAAINRSDIQTESQWDRTLVCSEHFVNNEKCYLHLKTNPSWLPTLQLGYTKCGQDTPASGRYDRACGRKRKRQEADAVSSLLSLNRRQRCSVGEAASASESPDLEQPADHFDETQYESGRADNLRKLRPNAVPTQFAFTPRNARHRKAPRKRGDPEDDDPWSFQKQKITHDHSYCNYSDNNVPPGNGENEREGARNLLELVKEAGTSKLYASATPLRDITGHHIAWHVVLQLADQN